MAGYTRQDTTGQLANGNPIDADLFNDEYDAIESAFNASTGHTHDNSSTCNSCRCSATNDTVNITSYVTTYITCDIACKVCVYISNFQVFYYGTDLQVGQDDTQTRDVSNGLKLNCAGNGSINNNVNIVKGASDIVTKPSDVTANRMPHPSLLDHLRHDTDELGNLL